MSVAHNLHNREGYSLTYSPSLLPLNMSHLTLSHRTLRRKAKNRDNAYGCVLALWLVLVSIPFSVARAEQPFAFTHGLGPAILSVNDDGLIKTVNRRVLKKRDVQTFSAEVIEDALQLLYTQGVNLPRCCCSNAAFHAYFIILYIIPHNVPTL